MVFTLRTCSPADSWHSAFCCKKGPLLSPLYVCRGACFHLFIIGTSSWIYTFILHNSFSTYYVVILMLRLSQIWPVGAASSCLLCLCNIPPSWALAYSPELFQAHFTLPTPALEADTSLRSCAPLTGSLTFAFSSSNTYNECREWVTFRTVLPVDHVFPCDGWLLEQKICLVLYCWLGILITGFLKVKSTLEGRSRKLITISFGNE